MASSSSAALFKEREKFVKRHAEESAFLAANEKRQKIDKPSSQKTNRSKSAIARSKTSSDFRSDYHTKNAAPKNLKLTNIVEKLQERFLSGQTDPLTLEEIIEESGLLIDASEKHWLASEALLSNPKVDVKRIDDVNKFLYKPPLDLKAPKKTQLLNLLKSRHEQCIGTITVDDVRETIPKAKADNIIESLVKSGEVVKFTTKKKEEVLFYTDRPYNLRVNPEFIESWRKISVEGLDDKKILKYFEDNGHNGLPKHIPRQGQSLKPSKRGGRRANPMKHNEHVKSQLVDYSNAATTK